MLSEEVTFYRTGVYTKIKDLGAKFFNESRVIKIEKNEAVLLDNKNKKIKIPFDNVVISSGFKCKSSESAKLEESFNGKIKEVFSIGDCMSVGRLYEAIHAGAETAWQI
jgi:hypothetical protein